MMNPKEAYQIIKKAKQELNCISACDYDSSHYIFAMSKNKDDEQPEWYWVDKNSGDWGAFNPGGDFMAFIEAMNSRSIPLNKLK